MKKIILALVLFCFLLSGVSFAATVLTVEKTREMALEYNRQLQTAENELVRSRGEIIAARAGAFPQLTLDGSYTRNITDLDIFFPNIFDTTGQGGFLKFPISQNNEFNMTLTLTQPLYNGGKLKTAWNIARIFEDYSREKVSQVRSEINFGAESMFYSAILAESRLEVIESSFEQLSHNLDVVEKFHSQGMVSEFELLRARVEKLNVEPKLMAAKSALNIARKQLKSFVGLSLDEEIELVADYSDTTIGNLPKIEKLVQTALEERPEMKQASLQKKGYDKVVRIAKSDWLYPKLDLKATYLINASSDDFKLYDNEITKNWSASLQLSIPLFDGGRTIGEVRKAKADYYQAVLAEEQIIDDIKLEVEQVYDQLIQAKKVLELQKETISQAEEGMRIANLRYKTGVGTQLEILSAQTALTDARSNLAGAIYAFRLTKAALRKAIGSEINL